MADERVRLLEASRRQLLIRSARLEAQRDDQDGFKIPEELDPRSKEIADIVSQETELLRTQRQSFAERLEFLRAQKPRLEAEIAGVTAQADAERTQLQLIRSHLVDYSKLLASGLARRYTGIELQREEARNEGNIARFAAEVARLEIGIGEVAIRINETKDGYFRQVLGDLADVRLRLRDLDWQIPVARELREARAQTSGGSLVAADQADPARRIVVVRTSGGVRETVEAGPDTLLQPGDIVDVSRRPLDYALPASGQAKRLALTPIQTSPQ
ncbi:hypothetical protein [Hansschlegelia zhihuaiae]|uniref:AprE-like long alpha-helical hairpin domain-containing protein n=1 Tax=Hansschlegelia zhihuaiae TaxID=405005 RepID=A0A4Q0MCA2_9HYPH|nr:hypothetical protein [Hansschlegelia zhihuaiae]RXF70950.1 hypothetical protein EK403_16210 [Hansschlegelia zhihuaiae]